MKDKNAPGGAHLRLCRIVTVPVTFATLLRQQIKCIVDAGIDLTLVSSPGPELDEIGRTTPVRCQAIAMARKPAPARDVRALVALTRFLYRERFDIVHSSTPKAGLLAALAGRAAQVPVRIHTYTGQAWVELSGPVRWIARECDRLIGWLDTHSYADSHSQQEFLIAEGLVKASKITVLGAGSISGVDLRRFDPALAASVRASIRHQLGIAEMSLVIVFVGRVTRDKGIVELLDAFRMLRKCCGDIHLVLVGPFEPERDPLPPETLEDLSADAHIHAVGFVRRPEEYLAAGDVFCLPSYREGFGSVVIEAGAMSLPAVTTQVTGLVDAIVDGETGILVPSKDTVALMEALKTMIESPELRHRMGQAARERARSHFDARVVNQAMVDEYYRLLGTKWQNGCST